MTDHHAHSDPRPDDFTITRYLGGDCDAAESMQVQRWLAADPKHRAELEALKTAWNLPPALAPDPDDQMWEWIKARMDEPLPRPRLAPVLMPPVTPRPVWRRIGLIAAALVLMLGGMRLVQLAEPSSLGHGAFGAPMQELIAPRGARVTANLPDGSRIILGPDSRLLVSATFAATPSMPGNRDVYLQSGEAFFEVTHDAARPFRVHTANGIAEDLGTEFVVTAYPEMSATRVVVASGIVALRGRESGARDGVILQAGDLGRVDVSGNESVARDVDLAAHIGWTKGELVFDNVPVQDAILQLGRWYDVDIELADSTLASQRFTATFHDEPIAQVLRVLEVAFDIGVERMGQRIVLRPRSPTAVPSR